MSNYISQKSWLEQTGLGSKEPCHFQLDVPQLIEEAITHQEGLLSHEGALVCRTGKFTGRSPHDKFIVQDGLTQDKVWWGTTNTPFNAEKFDILYAKMIKFLKDKRLYIQYSYANPLPAYRLSLRIITTYAWHSLFAHHLFLRPNQEELQRFVPDFLIIQAPDFVAIPQEDSTNNANFTIINFTKKIILIGGTGYAGEMKKAVFTVLNYLLPLAHEVLPMHCAVNVGQKDDAAFFFGLSGTGKTTLSADPIRSLIGDDEHGWYDEGVFNFEGGCYAKTIHLSKDTEPQIFNAIKFGTVVENMNFKPCTRILDYQDDSVTENIRAAYPLSYVKGSIAPAVAGHPQHIFFLTCDAYGVLPPIAQLDSQQAVYYFLTGYTAKIGGTEAGVTKPKAIFSPCFGAPFLPLSPLYYARLLAKKLMKNSTYVWLLNTGWVGGGYGVGERIALKYTRSMVTAALSGELEEIGFTKDPIFNLSIPNSCPNVPTALLYPAKNWPSASDYHAEASKILDAFDSNYAPYKNEISI